ncbi:MAG: hypothetical protein VX278_07335 [Myxococcota bacterium]|nr:hypothetical protein [Myxococcota bacterium]
MRILLMTLLCACTEKESDTATAEEASSDTPEINEPTDEPSQPATEPTDEPSSESNPEESTGPEEEPSDEPTDEPIDEPTDEPNDEPSTEPQENCTDNDLVWSVEVRDANGAASTFPAESEIQIAAVVYNPCDTTLSFTSGTSCLIGSLLVHGNNPSPDSSFLYEPFCSTMMTTWEVLPVSSVEEVVEVGVLPIDFYMLDLFFGDTGAHYTSTTFEVIP